MANEEHLAILEQGVDARNKRRNENFEIRANFIGSDINDANLSGADLWGANFSATNLKKCEY